MKTFQIWSEGYQATGNSSEAIYHGSASGENFPEACDILFKGTTNEQYYDRDKLTYWGCRLFDNEQEARRAFG